MPSCQCCARTHNPGTAKEVLLSLQWSPLFWGGHFFYFSPCNRTPKKGVAIFFSINGKRLGFDCLPLPAAVESLIDTHP